MAKNHARNGAPRDAKVIGLLNQLGERMIRGESKDAAFERTLSRCISLIENLEERAIRAETAEAVLRARQEKIEDEYSAQYDKIEKAVLLADRIDEAIAQQQRLNRRMEKVTQDKVRMIQKLERIEETVIETQDALRATALVITPPSRQEEPQPALGGFAAWMSGPMRMQAAGITALVALAILGGWAASRMQLSGMPQIAFSQEDLEPAEETALAQATPIEQPAQDYSYTETPAEPEAVADAETPVETPVEMMDGDQLAAAFDEDPDALAAQLNAIEPASAPADITATQDAPEEKSAPRAPDEATKAEPKKPAPVAKTMSKAQEEREVEAFLSTERDGRPLASRIAADNKLPSVVKEVERKAYDGVPEAQHDLAAIYTAGHGNVKIDYPRAASWFKEAALGGIANARYNLGVLYHQGLGVEKSVDKAIGWYRAAALLGHPEAQYNLGIAHIEGIGTTYDPHRAAMYFENAARGGVLEAAYNLGLIHENGLLGAPAPEQALFWYSRASDMGSPEAKAAMTQLAKSLDIEGDKLNDLIGAMKAQDDAAAGSREQQNAPAPKKQKTSSANSAPSEITAQSEPMIDQDEPPAAGISIAQDRPAGAPANPGVVAQIQEQLLRMGLFPGPADGDVTPQTEDAIRAYQTMNSLRRDGTPSEALLVHMLTSDMQAAEENGSRER